MKRSYLKKGGRFLFFCTVMILGAFLLFGCGDDGDTGPPGPPGPQGEKGDPGESIIGATAETCSLCHGEGSIADIAVAHPDDMSFQGDDVLIRNITLVNNAGTAQVNFDLVRSIDDSPITDLNGAPLTADDFVFVMADLVPANTPTTQWGTFASPYWERWAYERAEFRGTVFPQGTLTVNGGGNYTYDFNTAFNSATAMADAPDLDHTPGASHVQRLFIRFDGSDDPSIERGNGRGVGFLDFNVPLAGNPATALDPQRQFVTSTACEQCHSPNWERAAGGHTTGRRDIKACVICHSPIGFETLAVGSGDYPDGDRGAFMQENDTYASVFFHKIHAALDIPFWTEHERIRGNGYTDVTFPKHALKQMTIIGEADPVENLRDCFVCHNNDPSFYTGDTEALGGQAALIDNWKTNPSIEICSSCHYPGSPIGNGEVDLVTGVNHGGGLATNDECTVCHRSDTQSVAESIFAAHDSTPRPAGTNGDMDVGYRPENIPEFDVTLTLTPPANTTHYLAGDVITVTATLVDHATGQPVAPAVYTTSRDVAGQVGGGLREAYVQVSGPRARALPVLATDTFSDPNWSGVLGDIEDEHGMFIESADPQVKTDGTGFKYQLLPIPDDLDPGTYLVRVVFADYGRVGTGDYRIDSTAWTTIQIGTATEEPKVAGDACISCHGSGTAPFHDERHSVPFDTDQCLACHHDSGHDIGERVHGVPLANRVHAVHSANAEGDIYNFNVHSTVQASRDWTDITYPREIMNCNTCHNSQYDEATNTFEGTYKTLPYMMPCSGCHVGMANDFQGDMPFVPGVYDHMVQNGGPWLKTDEP